MQGSPRRVTGGYCIAHTVTRKYLHWWVISGIFNCMSKKKVMKEVVRGHQPSGGGYGVAVWCSCGVDFTADHQIEMILTAWEADNEPVGYRC